MSEVAENELEESVEAEEVSSIPEKFQGKSAEEIAESYSELEKEMGRKNNEVGELRKLTDQYIHQELSRREDPKESDSSIEVDDLLENPTEVISSVVKKQLDSVNQRFDQMNTQQRQEKFAADNPDYMDIGNSQEFKNWAGASPYRTKQFNAANEGDFDAADEILQGYRDQVLSIQEAAKKGEKVKRDKALNDASSETAGTGETSGKIFKRAELMKLQMTNPDKYWAMTEEIHQAYAEGRVK